MAVKVNDFTALLLITKDCSTLIVITQKDKLMILFYTHKMFEKRH